MNRSNFLKFATLGFFTPFLAKSKTTNNPIAKNSSLLTNRNYIKVTDHEDMNDGKCDGVIYIKEGKDYFYYQPATIDVKEFGAIGDGAKDDTIALQNAVNACVKNKKTLYLSRPTQSYLCYKKIIINGQIYIYGDGMTMCGINFMNTDGFEIAEGVSHVIFEKITINQLTRQTTKPNNFTAIKILGRDKKRPVTHIYRDVFIDGFNTAFKIFWLWDAQFDNVKILFGKVGFDIAGLSVNNNICDCTIQVEGNDSKAIFFSDKVNPAEGWKISNLLTFGADYGIHSIYTSNVYVTTPILDFCKKYGVYLESGDGPSTNWQIIGGYIAMSGNSAEAAISLNNEKDNNQIRGCFINGVDMLGYPDAKKSTVGIAMNGKFDVRNKVKDNSFTNFTDDITFKNNKKNENTVQ